MHGGGFPSSLTGREGTHSLVTLYKTTTSLAEDTAAKRHTLYAHTSGSLPAQ